jgi:hypothetical protein
VVLTTHHLLAPRSGKSTAIPLPPSGPSGLLRGTFTFYSYEEADPVAARSKAWVCDSSPAEIVGSNATDGMDVCRECCVLSGRGSLRRVDHSSRVDLLNVVRRFV